MGKWNQRRQPPADTARRWVPQPERRAYMAPEQSRLFAAWKAAYRRGRERTGRSGGLEHISTILGRVLAKLGVVMEACGGTCEH